MTTKAGKRPLRSLTAHEKLDAIRRVHEGESKASVARDIGVPESTLRGWCKNEDKISYMSRQSTPETDDSTPNPEPKEKKTKLEDAYQPYNLSLKPHSPTSVGGDYESAKPHKIEATKSATHISERERNRAELARLSIELGLNRPEMFLSNINTNPTFADIGNNAGLLAQWNNMLVQQQTPKKSNKITAAADTSTPVISYPPPNIEPKQKPVIPLPKTENPQTVDESVWYWLKTQQAMLGLVQNVPVTTSVANFTPTPSVTSSTPTPSNANAAEQNSSWFWKWYKQMANSYSQSQNVPDKPILYQQLTKSRDVQNSENLNGVEGKTAAKINNKARAVLDNVLINNNNNVAHNKREFVDDAVAEALEHGEQFLKWMECCSEPSVTAMQIMQFKFLLNNIRSSAERRNGEVQNKAKVKRK